jgi:predicted RNA-binding protein
MFFSIGRSVTGFLKPKKQLKIIEFLPVSWCNLSFSPKRGCDMCQTAAYVLEEEKETLVLEDVTSITPEDRSLRLLNLFGEERVIRGRIKLIDLLAHRVIIQPD